MTLYADKKTIEECQIPGLYRLIEDAYQSTVKERPESPQEEKGLAKESKKSFTRHIVISPERSGPHREESPEPPLYN
jgi:predicted transcriptional regulator